METGGRPTAIDKPIGTRDDGSIVTVADQIVAGVRSGLYLEPAAAAAGVAKDTYYGWLRTAGRLRIRHAGRAIDPATVTEFEAACLAFSDAVLEAEGVYETGANTTLTRLERGLVETTTTVTKQELTFAMIEGVRTEVWKDVERTVTIKQNPPDARVIMWRLERRFTERYGHKIGVEVAHKTDGALSDEERASELIDGLSAYLEGVADSTAPAGTIAQDEDHSSPSNNGLANNGDGSH